MVSRSFVILLTCQRSQHIPWHKVRLAADFKSTLCLWACFLRGWNRKFSFLNPCYHTQLQLMHPTHGAVMPSVMIVKARQLVITPHSCEGHGAGGHSYNSVGCKIPLPAYYRSIQTTWLWSGQSIWAQLKTPCLYIQCIAYTSLEHITLSAGHIYTCS